MKRGNTTSGTSTTVEYHQRLAPSGGNYASVPYSYGLADMNYYGGFCRHGRLRHDVAALSGQRQLEPLQ